MADLLRLQQILMALGNLGGCPFEDNLAEAYERANLMLITGEVPDGFVEKFQSLAKVHGEERLKQLEIQRHHPHTRFVDDKNKAHG